MAVMRPVRNHSMRDRPTEPEFSKTPFGLTKMPEPMMLPGKIKAHDCHFYNVCVGVHPIYKIFVIERRFKTSLVKCQECLL